MTDENKPLPDKLVNDLIAKARQISDASPADHSGDHPTASLAVQMWMLEETQRAAREQQAANEAAAREHRTESGQLLLQNGRLIKLTLASAFAAFLGVAAAIWSVWDNAAISFGQRRPLIDVTPRFVNQAPGTTITTIFFDVANYSGFDAHHIEIDIRLEDRYWTNEWMKAQEDRKKKGSAVGVEKGKAYFSSSKSVLPLLGKRGETRTAVVANAMDLESVCSLGQKGALIYFRIKWASASSHVFDELHKYRLLCTKDSKGSQAGTGRAFTFIPYGKISEK